MTEPYPGFPTDLQSQIMALMSTAEGAAMITESIFENRFMHVPELTRIGANLNVHGASDMVRGRPKLTGAEVMATDIRASVRAEENTSELQSLMLIHKDIFSLKKQNIL